VPSRRSSVRPFRSGRALLVAGVTAAAVLVPSVAWATTPADVACTVDQTVGEVAGTAPTCTAPDQKSSDAVTQESAPAATTSSAPALPPLDLSRLNALLAQAGISTECSTSVEADVQQLIADIPATADALLQEILAQLKDGGTGLPIPLTDQATGKPVTMTLVTSKGVTLPDLTSPDPAELPLLTGLQQLITDLLTKCIPAPTLPAAPTTSSAPVTSQAPDTTQPVSYLGYAPTGGSGPDGGSGSPALAVLGGGLLLAGGAGATWYGVRSRAARAKG
jgi:hypothetical protein